MGSKGQTTTQTQTYKPAPQISQAGTQALTAAESAAQQPFQMPAAPVAGFSPFQTQAFNQLWGLQGGLSPYVSNAAYQQGVAGAPITQQDIQGFINPYAQDVYANMQKYIFDPQRVSTMGSAVQRAGGVGADRLALEQQNLQKTQGDILSQAEAGFYAPALAAAQAEKQRALQSAQGWLGLGLGQQQGQLQATGALGTAGAQQQAQLQRQLMSPYQQELARLAYPFQTSQFLAGITGGLAPAFGGTTTGTMTAPAPSLLSQVLGLGTAGAGLYGAMGGFGGSPAYGGGNMFTNAYGGSAASPLPGLTAADYGIGFARGGTPEEMPTGGAVPFPMATGITTPPPIPQNMPSTAQAMQALNQYLATPSPVYGQPPTAALPTTGGPSVSRFRPLFQGQNSPFQTLGNKGSMSGLPFRTGFADGGDVSDDQPYPMFHNVATPTTPELSQMIPHFNLPMGGGQQTGAHLTWPTKQSGTNDAVQMGLQAAKLAMMFAKRGGEVEGQTSDKPHLTRLAGDVVQGPWRQSDADWRRYNTDQILRMMQTAPAEKIGPAWDAISRFGYSPTPVQPIPIGPQAQSGGGSVSPFDIGQAFYQEGGPTFNERFAPPASDWDATPVDMPGGPPVAIPRPTGGMAPMSFAEPAIPLAQPTAVPQARPPMAMPQAALPTAAPQSPAAELPYPQATQQDWGQSFARSPWLSLVEAGAKMASTPGPLGQSIGAGIQAGVGALGAQRKELRSEADINLKAQQLMESIKQHEDQYRRIPASVAEQHAIERERLDNQNKLIEKQVHALELEGLRPFKIGEDPNTGLDVYGIRDPKSNGIIPVNPMTGRPASEAAAPSEIRKPQEKQLEPPPLGTEELRPNLEPTKSTAPAMMKGPFATSEAQNIKAIDAQMNKARDSIDTQKDNLLRLKMDYATIMGDNDQDGFFKRMLTLPGAPVDPDKRVALMRAANATAMAAKKPLPFNPNKVAAYEEVSKIQKTMGFTFAATISPREAVQGQMMSVAMQPGLTQSPAGMQRLIGLYDGLNSAAEAKHTFWGRWKQANPRTATGWEEDFRAKNPAEKFTVRALIDNTMDQRAKAALPQAVEWLRTHKDNPAEVAKFDKIYGNTSSYFLTGHLNPYAGLQ